LSTWPSRRRLARRAAKRFSVGSSDSRRVSRPGTPPHPQPSAEERNLPRTPCLSHSEGPPNRPRE
jgi:hypothetical protein